MVYLLPTKFNEILFSSFRRTGQKQYVSPQKGGGGGGKKLIGLAKLSYLQDPISDRNFFLSATLAISWRPVLVVEEAGENHQLWASNW
jgi:hypothetical protein